LRADSLSVIALTISVAIVLLCMIVLIACGLILHRITLAARERATAKLADFYREEVLEFVGTPDAEPGSRLCAARTLEQRAAIASLLSSYSRMLRGEARQRIMTFLEREGYVDAAIADLRSLRAWRRGRAALTLGEFGSSRAVQQLSLTMIRDRSETVRLTAARALGRIDDYKAAAALLMVLPTDRVPGGVIAQALYNLGGRSLRALVDACDDDDASIRRVACRIVGLLGQSVSSDVRERVLDVLARRVANDPDPRVRVAACASVGELGGRGSVDVIELALLDADLDVRVTACVAAREMHLTELAEPLRRVIRADAAAGDPEPRVAREAAHALAQLSGAAQDAQSDARALAEAGASAAAEPVPSVARSPYVVEARAMARIREAA
jgi:HEAT repeat protein